MTKLPHSLFQMELQVRRRHGMSADLFRGSSTTLNDISSQLFGKSSDQGGGGKLKSLMKAVEKLVEYSLEQCLLHSESESETGTGSEWRRQS